MIARTFIAFVSLAAIGIGLTPAPARAQNCTAADFGAVVDQTAQALRELNGSGSKRFQAKISSLRDKHGLSQADIEARTTGLHDEKIEEFNREIESLVAQMDVLSQTPNTKINCDRLEELKRVRDRLLTVMGQKSGYILAKVEADLEAGGKPVQQAAAPTAATSPADPKPGPIALAPPSRAPEPPDARPQPAEPRNPPDARGQNSAGQRPAPIRPPVAEPPASTPSAPERAPGPSRVARNAPQLAPSERNDRLPPLHDGDERPTSLAPPPPGYAPPPPGDLAAPPAGAPLPSPAEQGYSISEIREAGRGIFGTITAEFGGAINYAFQNFGQPNAYITGIEGGAAFLAGLRYGKGTINRKNEPPEPIYWQGPSAGLDFGAEGSRALFLVYNLDDPDAIYGRFSGIGGSAYVAGGVGLNVLGKGKIVMVPIRSGLGLRLGANLAYVKFTERQTWNPF